MPRLRGAQPDGSPAEVQCVLEMRVGALTLAALAAAAAAAGAGAAGSVGLDSGLQGVVTRGPTTPVCREDPCEEPAAGVVLRFSRNGVVVARAKTGAGGGYTVRLRPGPYAVGTLPSRPGMQLLPRRVWVPAGRPARVDFHLDTGIQ